MPRAFYGWYIALAGAVSNFFILGTIVVGSSVFIGPVRDELGWSAAAIAVGFSLRSFEQGLLAPFTGMVVDRFGPRLMAMFGAVVSALGLLMFSQCRELWQYYAASVVMSLGMSLGGGTAYPTAVMHWFDRKRGRAMGVLNSGNAAGWMMVSLLALLISTIGWRSTALAGSVAVLFVGLAAAVVIRDRPEALGLRPDGLPSADSRSPAASSETGMAPRDAMRVPAFYLLAIAWACASATLVLWTIFLVPHLEEAGFSLTAIGVMTGLYGLLQFSLRFACGWLGDRFGRRRVLIWALASMGAGILAFAQLSPDRLWLLPIYFAVYGFGHSAAIVLQMTVIADYFGVMRFATIRGLITIVTLPVSIGAPLVAGWSFDVTGSYRLVFTVLAFTTVSAAVWVSLIRRPTWQELTQREVAERVVAQAAPRSAAT